MTFGRPVPFQAAIEAQAVKVALPTTLSQQQYRQLGGDLLRRAQISAKVQSVSFLDTVTGAAADLADGKMDYATGRAILQQVREGLAEENILDDSRLDLILRTQRETAQGYGQFIQGNDPDVVDAFPAQELYRLEDRKDPRNWEQRWRIAAQVAGDVDAQRVLEQTGRMIARKDSGVWQALGDGAGGYKDTLGNPYPPFAFNSGMDIRDISRSVALELGLIAEQTKINPQEIPDFNAGLDQPVNIRSAIIRDEIIRRVGDAAQFENGVLKAA
jgi:hypothetical protein